MKVARHSSFFFLAATQSCFKKRKLLRVRASCRNRVTLWFSRRLRIRHWEKSGRTHSKMLPSVFKLLNILKGRGFSCFSLEILQQLKKRGRGREGGTDTIMLSQTAWHLQKTTHLHYCRAYLRQKRFAPGDTAPHWLWSELRLTNRLSHLI